MRSILRAMAFLKLRKKLLGLLVLASAAYGGCTYAFVFILREVLEITLESKDESALWRVAGLMALTALGAATFAYARTMLTKYLSYRVARDAQNKVMAHLVNLPISYFHGQRSGELIARMTSDANSLRRTVGMAADFIKNPIELVALVAAALSIDWKLALLGGVGFPLAIVPLIVLSRKMRKASRKSRKKVADLVSGMVQIFGGIRLVRAYGQERTEHDRFVKTNESRFRQQMKQARAKALSRGMVELLSFLGLVSVVVVGGLMIIRTGADAKNLYTLILALMVMYRPAKTLAKSNEEIQSTIPGAERIFELQDVRNDMPDAPDAVEVGGLEKAIEIRNLSFRYDEDVPVLRDINLRVEKGQTVALVGHSGAGKSTLLDLVCRFYDPQEGSVTLDGIDLRSIKLKTLLAQIAVVPQEPFLFNDTVKANILYGRPDASQEDVEAAARAAAVHDEIVALADGYDTVVGERGTLLSGGQRQRVSIARALLRNAPILVLDEATSSLDSESERLVQTAVERLLEGRTTLVIAHRLSTIKNADRIAVLVAGRIEETGSHAELLERSETYRRLWQMQGAGPAEPAEAE